MGAAGSRSRAGSTQLSPCLSPLVPAASIFSLKEIQLQKDPGYRGLAFQQPGRGLCLPHRFLSEETRAGCFSLSRNRNGAQQPLLRWEISMASLMLATLWGPTGHREDAVVSLSPAQAFSSSVSLLNPHPRQNWATSDTALMKVHAPCKL